MRIEKIVIGHSILTKKDDFNYFDLLFNNFDLGVEVISFYLVSYVLTFLLLLFLIDLSKRVKQRKEANSLLSKSLSILRRFFSDGAHLSPLGFFLLCADLYLWHTLLFLTNNIKTNKVTIDTTDLITSSYDIYHSERVVCFLKHETEMKIALNSPKGNFEILISLESNISS